MHRKQPSWLMTSSHAMFRFLFSRYETCLMNCFQSLLDAKLLTINSETLSPDSIVSLNLK